MSSDGTRRRRSLKWPALILLLLTLIGAAPIISVLISSAIASAFGCALDEGGAHPCLVHGHDLGEMLNVMFVAGWFQLLTWPLVAVAAIGWLVLGAVAALRAVRG